MSLYAQFGYPLPVPQPVTNVLLSDGSYGIIEKVRDIHYDSPQTTYNFEVEDYHTYYVSTGVLVHNKDCGGRGINGASDLVLDVKNENYIAKRGWTMTTMDAAIKDGVKGITTNLATNNVANVYTAANGSYIVVDSVTNQLVQLSQYGNAGWIPHPPITWF